MLPSGAMPEQSLGPWRFDIRRLVRPLLLALIAVKLLLLFVTAVESRYVADEYYQGGYSIHIPEGFYRGIEPVKTVLYTYFYQFARRIGHGSVELMLVARLQGFVLAAAMAALVLAVSRRLGADREGALFSVFVLLSFTNFMERSFRVRGDTLAVFLALVGLWLAVGRPQNRWRQLASGLAVGAAFLSTQKTVYYAVAFGLAYLAVGFYESKKRSQTPQGSALRLLSSLAPAAIFSLGWCISVLVYAIYFGGMGWLRVLIEVFLAPWQLAFHGDEAYLYLREHLVQTLLRNHLAYGLGFAGLALGASRWRQLLPPQRLSWIVTVVVTALVLAHNQPWPYVFVMAIPLLATWSPAVIDRLAPEPREETGSDAVATATARRHRGELLVFLIGVLALSFVRNGRNLQLGNGEQNRVAASAESLLQPEDRYADGVGMIPTRHRAGDRWWWDAAVQETLFRAAEDGDYTALNETFADHPKLWIVNYRVEAMRRLIGRTLDLSYVAVDPNILLAGAALDPKAERLFLAPWPGRYRLYGPDGKPEDIAFLVDGTPVEGEIELTVGSHRLALADSGDVPALLLPTGLTLSGPLPAAAPPLPLFAGGYD